MKKTSALPLYAVIMAGGQGTRFWPSSRRRLPKQLLRITGKRSLLQDTAMRLRRLVSWRHMLVVTNVEHGLEVSRQLPQLPRQNILVEPCGRNTLACLALANEWIRQRHADATIIAAPADHLIKDSAALCDTLAQAARLAESRPALVTLGVRPTRPETGYGYIEVGAPIEAKRSAAWVRRFREKPSLARARSFMAQGNFLWNSGIFVWRASSFAAALQRFVPEVAAAMQGVWEQRKQRAGNAGAGAPMRAAAQVKRVYEQLPNLPVDVAIFEPASTATKSPVRVAVVPAEFDWNDVGSWLALADVWGTDAHGNAKLGEVIAIDTRGAIVFSPQRLVALVGVQGMIVVDTPDALLICARERAQDVRRVTQEIERRGWSRYL